MSTPIMAHRMAEKDPTENPWVSLHDTIVFSSDDWSGSRAMAWVYGIVCGWDDDEDDDVDAMAELAIRFGWDAARVARLRRLRAEFARLAEVHATQPELLGYLPLITHDGRRLAPGDHMSISPTRPPEGVAVWSYGPPEAPGDLIGHAVAVDAGDGWFADTVSLDGSYSDADCRHHDWLSANGYRAMVVELREVAE